MRRARMTGRAYPAEQASCHLVSSAPGTISAASSRTRYRHIFNFHRCRSREGLSYRRQKHLGQLLYAQMRRRERSGDSGGAVRHALGMSTGRTWIAPRRHGLAHLGAALLIFLFTLLLLIRLADFLALSIAHVLLAGFPLLPRDSRTLVLLVRHLQ